MTVKILEQNRGELRGYATTVMRLCLGLALAAALVYFLTGAGVLETEDLKPDESPPGIAYVAGACYVAGGFLILTRKRRLWVAGAIVNALVIVAFVGAYVERPSVLLCAPGVASKVAQILLEVGLVYLILTHKREVVQ